MKLFITNILSVSKYESKLLFRSWFFKVFTALTMITTLPTACTTLVSDHNLSLIEAIPSIYAYQLMNLFNIGQAVVAIFLASEYLKRDKQLDTSEIFYVRPLSNAEYLLGKMWGTLRVFILLNLLVVTLGLIVAFPRFGAEVDVRSFFVYLFLLNIPTLVYIVGLSTILMLVIRNQSLTFIILLAYIGLTAFYVGDKCYYLFDYMCYNTPLLESTITGFADLHSLIIHRMMYLLLGLGFILLSIPLFRRLPNSVHALLPWKIIAGIVIATAVAFGYIHINGYVSTENYQDKLVELNNQYANHPKIVMDTCAIEVKQEQEKLYVQATVSGRPTKESNEFLFTLNPGLKVTNVEQDGQVLSFIRNEHLLKITFPKKYIRGDNVYFTINYEGVVDERICYLDIPDELLNELESNMFVKIGKRYAFQDADFTMLTPESYWYPRPGVCYSSESPDWQQSFFTHYCLQVTPNPGLTPVSQGTRKLQDDSATVAFTSEYPLQSLSLVIGDYENMSIEVDSTTYSVWYIKGHDEFSHQFDSIQDTLPSAIRDIRRNIENEFKMPYPFHRFSMIEAPVHFATYSRTWTRAQECMQPELAFIPERGFGIHQLDFKRQKKWRKESGNHGRRGRRRVATDIEIEIGLLNMISDLFRTPTGGFRFEQGGMGRNSMSIKDNPYQIFPQLYNFKYNIYSSEWPVANRLIELRLHKIDQASWLRDFNGLSNQEKAILLLQENSFKDLLSAAEHRDLLNYIIEMQGKDLFIDIEQKIGVKAFGDTLFNYITAQPFANIRFETLLDSLERLTGCTLKPKLEAWKKPIETAEYVIGTPLVTKISNREKEIYQGEIIISNISDKKGFVNLKLNFWSQNGEAQTFEGEDKPTEWVVHLEPHQTKRIVSHWEEAPNQFLVQTLYSRNLPTTVTVNAGQAEDGERLTREGEYILSSDYLDNTGEIIVDNEDEHLFTLSDPPPSGLLNEWVQKKSDEEHFRYSGMNEWNPPVRWTPVVKQDFYGKSIRSAVIIASGNGNEYARWKIPVPEYGRYDLFYHVYRPEELRRRGSSGKKLYRFYIEMDDEEELVELNVRHAGEGWAMLGSFNVNCDTMTVTLTNETGLKYITADAVKLVGK